MTYLNVYYLRHFTSIYSRQGAINKPAVYKNALSNMYYHGNFISEQLDNIILLNSNSFVGHNL